MELASLIVTVTAMTPALAHALEFPGKLRLTKDQYFAVQKIYYPGFTIAGFAEPVAAVSMLILLLLTPAGSPDFWLVATAFVALVGMHAVYWLFTHPVNKYWVEGAELRAAGASFFSFASAEGGPADWLELRDRWEYSHLARAVLAVLSFLALAVALPVDR
jgi:hypothetical protein